MSDPSGNTIEPASATRRTQEPPSESLTSIAPLSAQSPASESVSVNSQSVDNRQNQTSSFDIASYTPRSQPMFGDESVSVSQQARVISFYSKNENFINPLTD